VVCNFGFSDEGWNAPCKTIGSPKIDSDEKYRTVLGRKENEEELDKLIEQWTVNYTREEVVTILQGIGVAAGMV